MEGDSYIITIEGTRKKPIIRVVAPGDTHLDGRLYLRAETQAALLAFLDSLCEGTGTVVWDGAQPDTTLWTPKRTARGM